MAIVEAQITKVDPVEALRQICRAFFARFGRFPTQSEATCLWAFAGLESALFVRVANNNAVGLKPGSGWTGDVAVHRTHEYEGDLARASDEGFRAYASLYESFYDWLGVLAAGYPLALAGAAQGDVEKMVAGLQRGWGRNARYATAPEALYRAGVERCLGQLVRLPGIPWADLTSRRFKSNDEGK